MSLLTSSPVFLNPKKRWKTSAISQEITYLLAKGFAYLKKTQYMLPSILKYAAVTLTIFLERFFFFFFSRQVQYLPAGFPDYSEKLIPGPRVTSTVFSYKRRNQWLLNYDP